MVEEKRNRIMAAFTVNVILLIVILAAVVIYQLIVITGVAREKARIEQEIAEYEKKIQDSKDDLEYFQSENYLRDLAIEYGYRFPN